MKALIVIDVQNDFVTGSLGTKEAVEMLPRLLRKVEAFDGALFLTKDTHEENYLETQEGSKLPVAHCIRGTEGWQIVEPLDLLQKKKGAKIYEKPCFGSTALVHDLKKMYDAGEIDSVELTGLCTDICVVSNALMIKAAMPELPVSADADCCAGVTLQKHEAALEVMASCQIDITRSKEA